MESKTVEERKKEILDIYTPHSCECNSRNCKRVKGKNIYGECNCSYLEARSWHEEKLDDLLDQAVKEAVKIDENTSDGYHTFKELYRYRMLYNAAFFNELAKKGEIIVYRSKRHSDGELCFGGGWFVVVAELPTGQISNHYELKDWDLFNVAVLNKAQSYDGHTPEQAAERLEKYLKD